LPKNAFSLGNNKTSTDVKVPPKDNKKNNIAKQ
jgi:hypothetical protein